MDWLIGKWQTVNDNRRFTEEWHRATPGLLEGTGKMEVREKTVFAEKLRIEERNGTAYYVVTVTDQNEGQAIFFKMQELHKNRVVFSNPEHDFPQRIEYRKISADEIIIHLTGEENDTRRIMNFRLTRCSDDPV